MLIVAKKVSCRRYVTLMPMWVTCFWLSVLLCNNGATKVYQSTFTFYWQALCYMFICVIIGKYWAAKSRVILDYLKIGHRSVKPGWKHWIFTSNYRFLHTWVPYNTAYGWHRPNAEVQFSLFTYTTVLLSLLCNNIVILRLAYEVYVDETVQWGSVI